MNSMCGLICNLASASISSYYRAVTLTWISMRQLLMVGRITMLDYKCAPDSYESESAAQKRRQKRRL